MKWKICPKFINLSAIYETKSSSLDFAGYGMGICTGRSYNKGARDRVLACPSRGHLTGYMDIQASSWAAETREGKEDETGMNKKSAVSF